MHLGKRLALILVFPASLAVLISAQTDGDATVVGSPEDVITYMPPADKPVDVITRTVSDGSGGTMTETASVRTDDPASRAVSLELPDTARSQIESSDPEDARSVPYYIPNLDPITPNFEVRVSQDRPTTIVPEISDPNDDRLDIIRVTGASKGEVTLSPPGIVYRPFADELGIDRISYTVSDGRGGRAAGVITIIIFDLPPDSLPRLELFEGYIDITGYAPGWADLAEKRHVEETCDDIERRSDPSDSDLYWCQEYQAYLLYEHKGASGELIRDYFDITDYTPDWAASKDEKQLAVGCDLMPSGLSDPDLYWCQEYLEYIESLREGAIDAPFEDYVDITGYTPDWAEPRSKYQAKAVCDARGSDLPDPDFHWCQEYSVYMLYILEGAIDAPFEGYIDITGYTPDWAEPRSRYQMAAFCVVMIPDLSDSDLYWCQEYMMYMESISEGAIDAPFEGYIDITGYTPDWVESKSKYQVGAVCDAAELRRLSLDPYWCHEYTEYLEYELEGVQDVLFEGYTDDRGHTPEWAASKKSKNEVLGSCDAIFAPSLTYQDVYWCYKYLRDLHSDIPDILLGDYMFTHGAPVWAKSDSNNQIPDSCDVVYKSGFSYLDIHWCYKYLKRLQYDHMPSLVGYVDITGYTPAWAAAPAHIDQIIKECKDQDALQHQHMYLVRDALWQDRDEYWCFEYMGLVNDLVYRGPLSLIHHGGYVPEWTDGKRFGQVEAICFIEINYLPYCEDAEQNQTCIRDSSIKFDPLDDRWCGGHLIDLYYQGLLRLPQEPPRR